MVCGDNVIFVGIELIEALDFEFYAGELEKSRGPLLRVGIKNRSVAGNSHVENRCHGSVNRVNRNRYRAKIIHVLATHYLPSRILLATMSQRGLTVVSMML